MSRHRAELWCGRSKHRLAWLEVGDSGEVQVCVTAIAAGRQQASTGVSRIPASQVRGPDDDPFTRQWMIAGCACKARYDVELVSLLDGKPIAPRRRTGDEWDGVSWNR